MFGILLISLFIIFFPMFELSTCDPKFSPILAKFPVKPLPLCFFLESLYLLILPSLSRSDVEGVNFTFLLLPLLV